MWWPRTAVLVALLALGACGYKPLYGEAGGQAMVEELTHIQVDTIANREGQFLRNHLIAALAPRGIADPIRHNLRVKLSEDERTYLLRPDETATRAELTVMTAFELVDHNTGAVVTKGRTRRVAGYNLADAEYAAVVAKRTAREAVLKLTAEDIARRLAAHFRRR